MKELPVGEKSPQQKKPGPTNDFAAPTQGQQQQQKIQGNPNQCQARRHAPNLSGIATSTPHFE
jgi:hypothetical protein